MNYCYDVRVFTDIVFYVIIYILKKRHFVLLIAIHVLNYVCDLPLVSKCPRFATG